MGSSSVQVDLDFAVKSTTSTSLSIPGLIVFVVPKQADARRRFLNENTELPFKSFTADVSVNCEHLGWCSVPSAYNATPGVVMLIAAEAFLDGGC